MGTPPGGGSHTPKIYARDIRTVTAARLHLTNGEIQGFEELFTEYDDIFVEADEDDGRTNKVCDGIDTGDAGPFRQPQRRIPMAKQAEVKEIFEKMQQHCFVEESESPWLSSVVLVREKNGELRFFVDYRKLNDVTKRDYFPLPLIDDNLDTLAGAKWFSTLELRSGYWQINVQLDDKEKREFSMLNAA
jgi:hypothetical protein